GSRLSADHLPLRRGGRGRTACAGAGPVPSRLRRGRLAPPRIACLVLKVMHVVHHVDARGLLHRARVSEDELCQLVSQPVDHCIAQLRREGFPVVAAAGSVKTRHSLITKLLAKKETLAAQIYDKVRYRVETTDRDHVLPVLVRLCDLLIPFNFVVPGQTQNTLISFRELLRDWPSLKPLAPELQMDLQEEEQEPEQNEFSGDSYKMLNFVAELPVRLPERAVDAGDGRIAFCMVELQLVDRENALGDERGGNAHLRYKRRQLRRVLRRLSRGLVVPRRPTPAK